MCTRFWWESPKKRDCSDDSDIDGRMGSKWILRRLAAGGRCIQLAQDRDRWQALVNVVMNLQVLVPQN
jgi:hypothetical protein